MIPYMSAQKLARKVITASDQFENTQIVPYAKFFVDKPYNSLGYSDSDKCNEACGIISDWSEIIHGLSKN